MTKKWLIIPALLFTTQVFAAKTTFIGVTSALQASRTVANNTEATRLRSEHEEQFHHEFSGKVLTQIDKEMKKNDNGYYIVITKKSYQYYSCNQHTSKDCSITTEMRVATTEEIKRYIFWQRFFFVMFCLISIWIIVAVVKLM